ncbi:MAG TPA: hypothetical protein VFH43_10335, partial [Candidatus Kapabacteria bacterium]|nr:hypothetical protein [Candidatus Kapabacteria bacterium]
MKLLIAVLLLFASFAGDVNAQQFEGLIVYRIQTADMVIEQKSWVKGDSVVIEAEDPMPRRSFANFANQEFRVFQGQTPQLHPLRDFEPQYEKTSNLKPQPEYQTINGMRTQLYTVDIPTNDRKLMTTSFWLTAELPAVVGKAIARNLLIGTAADKMYRDIATEIRDMGKAPLMLTVAINGEETMSMQVITATEQS